MSTLRAGLLEPTTEVLFTSFPKIARWNREVIVTEKLDGTNAAVVVSLDGRVFAQSRKRMITPEKDNFGFAGWVRDHEAELLELGPGVHFGEWWGLGIQRGYDLDHRRFSLFNTSRWAEGRPECCHVVPTLGRYDYPEVYMIGLLLDTLRECGSCAAPGFQRPEGIVIFHTHANVMFKVTLEDDEKPKGQVPR